MVYAQVSGERPVIALVPVQEDTRFPIGFRDIIILVEHEEECAAGCSKLLTQGSQSG